MEQVVLDGVGKRSVSSASETAVEILGRAGIKARLLLMHFPHSSDVATVQFLTDQQQKSLPFILQSSMLRPLYTARAEDRGHATDFRKWDQEVDARSVDLDTDASVMGWLVTNIAFPSTSVQRDGGDADLQARLAKSDFKTWLLAAQADPEDLEPQQQAALGFLRVGYTATEVEQKLQVALEISASAAREIVAELAAALHVGLVKKRTEPATWLGIVASTQPERWYYYPQPTEPFPQLGFSIKVGEYLEDLDRLVLDDLRPTEERR